MILQRETRGRLLFFSLLTAAARRFIECGNMKIIGKIGQFGDTRNMGSAPQNRDAQISRKDFGAHSGCGSLQRKNVKILDCTLRDGGLVNDSNFTAEFAAAVVSSCAQAGVDVVEVGFKNSRKFFSAEKYGAFRFCDEEIVLTAKGAANVKIAVLMDVLKCEPSELAPKKQSAVDIVRCAFYATQISEALEVLETAAEKGYETAACMMAASTIEDGVLDENLGRLCACGGVDTIYLMDSFGALLPDKFALLARKYSDATSAAGKKFGVHAHNNLQCAFANELSAVSIGADVLDCTIGGLGKGAGNCPTELLVGALRGAKRALPVVDVSQNLVEPIKNKYRCADYPQYMLTALLNEHPRAAMNYFAENKKLSAAEFFESLGK